MLGGDVLLKSNFSEIVYRNVKIKYDWVVDDVVWRDVDEMGGDIDKL